MSIEALWALMSPDLGGGPPAGSVVVLETGRIFGGDSALATVGTYEIADGIVRGEARSFQYHGGVEGRNVFNMPMPIDYIVGFEVTRGEDENWLTGHIWPRDNPELRLPVELRRIADLPG